MQNIVPAQLLNNQYAILVLCHEARSVATARANSARANSLRNAEYRSLILQHIPDECIDTRTYTKQ